MNVHAEESRKRMVNGSVQIVRPEREDYVAMAEILVSGWRTSYRDIVSDVYLETLSAEHACEEMLDNKKGNAFFVAKIENKTVAFCRYSLTIPMEKQDGFDGTISELYVNPELKHKGIGSILFEQVMRDFERNGNHAVLLGCFSANTPSLQFYEKMGGKAVYEKDLVIGGEAYSTTFFRFELKCDTKS